jgi:hypothetical protein
MGGIIGEEEEEAEYQKYPSGHWPQLSSRKGQAMGTRGGVGARSGDLSYYGNLLLAMVHREQGSV